MTEGDDAPGIIPVAARVAAAACRREPFALDDTYLSNEARAALLAIPLPTGVLDLRLVREE